MDPLCRTQGHRPDDLPEPGDHCKDCGKDLVWVGPSFTHDWIATDEQEEL